MIYYARARLSKGKKEMLGRSRTPCQPSQKVPEKVSPIIEMFRLLSLSPFPPFPFLLGRRREERRGQSGAEKKDPKYFISVTPSFAERETLPASLLSSSFISVISFDSALTLKYPQSTSTTEKGSRKRIRKKLKHSSSTIISNRPSS